MLEYVSKIVLKLHLKVAGAMGHEDWDLLDHILRAHEWAVYKKTVVGQKRKFKKYFVRKDSEGPGAVLSAVVNLNSKTLDQATQAVLSKGLNFVIAPAAVPFKETMCEVETAVMDLPLSEAEEVSGEVVHLLKSVEPLKPNLCKAEKGALQAICQDDSVVVLKSDKGNASVILDQAEIII